MELFCVVISGRLPGDWDDAAVWMPVAKGFGLDYEAFKARIMPRFPMSVKRGMAEDEAVTLAERLRRVGADAQAYPDEAEQMVFERGGTVRGPLPRGLLGQLIVAGERYRLMGDASSQWERWTDVVMEPGPTWPVEEVPTPVAAVDSTATVSVHGVPEAQAIPSDAPVEVTPAAPPAWTLPPPDFQQVSHVPPALPGEVPPPPTSQPVTFAMPPVPQPEKVFSTKLPWEQGTDAMDLRPIDGRPAGNVETHAGRQTTFTPEGSKRGFGAVVAGVVLAVVVIAAVAYFARYALQDHAATKTPATASADMAMPTAVAPAKRAATPATVPAPAQPAQPPVVTTDGVPSAMDCTADAPSPHSPEDQSIVANGRRHLTGNAVRGGPEGDIYVVEVALGYDGQCRPDPYQIYVFRHQQLVGTLSPEAMRARTDGAITAFKLADATHLEVQVAHYDSTAPACCASRVETRIVDLEQFATRQEAPVPEAAAVQPAVAATPSFDCKLAQSPVELSICSSPGLAQEDAAMGMAYHEALNRTSPAQAVALKADQRQWLRERDQQCGSDRACIEQQLRTRTRQLTGTGSTGLQGNSTP